MPDALESLKTAKKVVGCKQVRRAITPYSDRIVTLRGVGYRFEKNNG